MKKLIFYPIVFAASALILFGTTNCTKDKVPVVTANNCTDTIHFSTQIMPVIQNYCISCHDVGGTAPTITNHAEIAANADAIVNALNGTTTLMPQGGPQLPADTIQHFSCWISQGKLDN